jgi:hypothetical protein
MSEMKEIIALIVSFAVSGSAIFLAVSRRIGSGLTAVFLTFSLLAGLAIANYDLLRDVKWEVPGISLFRNEVDQLKEQVFEDLRYEGESQRQTIRANVSDLNATSEKLDAGIKYAEALLEAVKKAEDRLKVHELSLKEQTARMDQTAERAAAAYGAIADLALLLAKTTWLQFQAKDDIDVKRRDLAVRQVMDQLDVIVGAVIEDPQVRSEFVNSVMGSLPPRP